MSTSFSLTQRKAVRFPGAYRTMLSLLTYQGYKIISTVVEKSLPFHNIFAPFSAPTEKFFLGCRIMPFVLKTSRAVQVILFSEIDVLSCPLETLITVHFLNQGSLQLFLRLIDWALIQ